MTAYKTIVDRLTTNITITHNNIHENKHKQVLNNINLLNANFNAYFEFVEGFKNSDNALFSQVKLSFLKQCFNEYIYKITEIAESNDDISSTNTDMLSSLVLLNIRLIDDKITKILESTEHDRYDSTAHAISNDTTTTHKDPTDEPISAGAASGGGLAHELSTQTSRTAPEVTLHSIHHIPYTSIIPNYNMLLNSLRSTISRFKLEHLDSAYSFYEDTIKLFENYINFINNHVKTHPDSKAYEHGKILQNAFAGLPHKSSFRTEDTNIVIAILNDTIKKLEESHIVFTDIASRETYDTTAPDTSTEDSTDTTTTHKDPTDEPISAGAASGGGLAHELSTQTSTTAPEGDTNTSFASTLYSFVKDGFFKLFDNTDTGEELTARYSTSCLGNTDGDDGDDGYV